MKAELIYGMPREAYDALKADNISRLKLIEQSPAHYRYGVDHGQEDTDALRFGRAAHLWLLEPTEYPDRVAVWRNGRRSGKEWDAFKESNAGRDIITEDEEDLLHGMQRAADACEFARPFLTGGHAEVTLTWGTEIVPGHVVPTKGRIDYETPSALVDVKFVRNASPAAFGRQAWDLSYFAQGAFYRDGYEAATGKRKPFAFVVVEKEPPYCVCVYVMTEEQHARGREDYQRWLATLSLCRLDDKWPGYATAPMPVVLPPWAQRQAEQSLTAEQAEAAQ